MKKRELTIREKVQAVVADKTITDYRIAKETGFAISTVQDVRNGKTKIDNLRLHSAEAYAFIYDKFLAEKASK